MLAASFHLSDHRHPVSLVVRPDPRVRFDATAGVLLLAAGYQGNERGVKILTSWRCRLTDS